MTTDAKAQHYTFGENDLAAERLRLLAAAFEPSSELLLRELSSRAYDIAIDLGCGPGYTTELVQRVLRPRLAIGVDRSPALLAIATRRTHADGTGLRFEEHDLAQVPLRLPRADLMYCRYLLTHLADPTRVLRGWVESLAEGGVLVLEETAAMESSAPVFSSYYAHVERLQQHYGQQMYIGTQLPALCEASGYRVQRAPIRDLQLPAATMARLHAMNLDTWSKDPFAISAFDPAELAALGRELAAVVAGTRAAPPVRHRLQQVIASKGS
jgi:trans-aconitate 2-methyltransferase